MMLQKYYTNKKDYAFYQKVAKSVIKNKSNISQEVLRIVQQKPPIKQTK